MGVADEVKKYYAEYDEENRLIKDNAHKIEFITTTTYLNKYIKKGSKILDVGAGTGRYSFYYYEQGFDVTALELCEKHINIMVKKTEELKSNLNIIQGNALDLSVFENDSFDVVLCLGPIYHLTDKVARDKCIKECLRVLKPNGVLAVAYVNRLTQFIKMISRDKDNINDIGLQRIVDHGSEFGDSNDCFYFSTYEEIEDLMNSFEVKKLDHLGTDGMSDLLRNRVNEFSDSEFDLWLKYHLNTCKNASIIGYSMHGLYICRAN